MNPYETMLLLDMATTLGLELYANLKDNGEELTPEQFAEIAVQLKARRKEAMEKIRAH